MSLKVNLTDATGILLEVYRKCDTDYEPVYLDADIALNRVSEHFNISHSNAAKMLINASENEPVMVDGCAYWTELPLPD